MRCPEGANCIESGTVFANVTAQAGYFLGLDGSGTLFIECLNDACDTGGCAQHYTVALMMIYIYMSLSTYIYIYIYIYIYSELLGGIYNCAYGVMCADFDLCAGRQLY